ncbi:gamma-glutamyltransferase [Sandaracinobacter sp. RS1-74]|uniref:gamma-glutamyltransferase n=1 Tax=Sandaracinobacteroides sayramensis TaxID=2913411 RepID=UPI001EDAEAC9|nr:gamma-glutamyltransferase [Sandaracinobacteroides sayramensis]MCG2839821.1 gamma-glutamyltransferase [Sandaracinobacteroides sayramensis]
MVRIPLLAALGLATLSSLAITGPASAQTVAAAARVDTAPATSFYEPGSATLRREPIGTVASAPQIASAADPLAAAAGAELLRAGGNAADAALAMMIALTVVEPQSSGIGGGGFLLWHDAATGTTHSLDGRERAPAAAGPTRFLLPDGTPMPFQTAVPGGYSVGVPGAVALIAEAHKRWGKRPWAELFAPAIRQAREGFPVTPRYNRFADSRKQMLRADPAAARIFLDADGEPWPIGHVLKQPELAATLETIAAQGPDAFYKGPIGAEITKAVANAFQNPAALTAEDLAAYQATERPPLCAPYRRWKICSMGPPSSGGTAVLQILKQLERFDMAKLGPDNLLSQHLFAESQRLAYADREAYGADADFAPVPTEGLIAPDYIAARSALIRLDRAMPSAQAGVPKGAAPRKPQKLADIPSTSHIVAADSAGNVATLTSTIEGPFGSGLVAAGFLLNNQLTDFDLDPRRADGSESFNAVLPGKRPRSSMAPTIVYDQAGNPVAAFGAAGGATIIAQVAKAIIAHLDWGLPVEQALAFPQIYADRRGLRYEEGTRLAGMAAGLQALGHRNVQAATLPLKGNAVQRVGDGWRGAADPRSEGQALGAPVSGAAAATGE